MENKRQIVAKKVDKFVFNVKHLNMIISAFLALFIVMFLVCYSKESAYIVNTFNAAIVVANILNISLLSIFISLCLSTSNSIRTANIAQGLVP